MRTICNNLLFVIQAPVLMSNSDLSRKSWLACYGEFMQSCLRRFGSAADAEDVAHDAVEALLQKKIRKR
jgi:DNA-directed RNA polymerase specialized sigma24 family protein